jgi:cell volume regulation protein A
MALTLALAAIVVLVCISSGQFLHRFGVPALLIFLVLGILTGSLADILNFSQHLFDPHAAETLGELALIFVMFYGGFGTKWSAARPVAVSSGLLASVGVLITAAAVMVFTHFVFGLSWAESFLFGAVISCTDGASVFSLLRTKRLNLKNNSVSILEIESGSNDPTAYLLTLVALLILQGQNLLDIPLLIVKQLVFGVLIGVGVALLFVPVILRFSRHFADGMDLLFVFASALLTYALATLLGGNGYLAAFLCGIILGNSAIPNKVRMAHFFDSVDWLGQILIFFTFGLLVDPYALLPALLPSIGLTLFLLVIARPLAIFIIYRFFKAPVRQMLLLSWVGLRGAASLVFALMAILSGVMLEGDLFHIVVLTALFSIALQGTLIEQVARRLGMIDTESDVMRSFTDYESLTNKAFLKLQLQPGHEWIGRALRDLKIGQESLIVLVRRGNKTIVPNGDTVLEAEDMLVLTGESYSERDDGQVEQIVIEEDSDWADHLISEVNLPENTLIADVSRADGEHVTPRGFTRLHAGDTVTLLSWDE